MPTDERNSFTKLSDSTGRDLARYGIMRDKAEKGAPLSGDGPNLFGLRGDFNNYELKFDSTPQQIQTKGMQLATVAPDLETFDMLEGKSFNDKLNTKPIEQLRAYLRRVFDES